MRGPTGAAISDATGPDVQRYAAAFADLDGSAAVDRLTA
jgi:hypothetical protein